MKHLTRLLSTTAAAVLLSAATSVQADAVVDWNVRAGQLVIDSKMGTPPAVRAMAIVQTAVDGAVNAITRHHPPLGPQPDDAPGASVDAAVAAAHRVTLAKLMPTQQAAVDAAYTAALAAIPESASKAAGIAVGERAGALVLAARADDFAAVADGYRPSVVAGVYVPTATPAVPTWAQRKPWVLPSAQRFRPAPPPALTSERWARDYEEVRALGGKQSARRTPEQTEVARFWEFSLPSIYHGPVRSVASVQGRSPADNARLFAAVAQAMDDALIAVFDAKYHYHFWRPATAIRNGDIDGNDATEREPGWASFIDTPLHPEYPSAHAVLAGAVGAVLKTEVGTRPMPVLSTASPSAKGAVRQWTSADDLVREVAEARIYEGVHYRFSVEVGAAMGKAVGELAAQRLLASPQ
jgi:membrane-associated phospholipid phosphatase